jgi:type I restriction enzyme S subunit
VRVRNFGEGERKQSMADPRKYKHAAKGDLTYNMMRMWQGALGVSPIDGLVSPAYVVAHPFGDVEARYYAYLFRTDAYMNEVDKFSRGIVKDRNRLYWEDFKRIPSLYPPKNEQAAIVRFLDYVEIRIRRSIRAKRSLIDLLNEQKHVIIHQAVTRGLNPNVRFKPSGVGWLGDVPAHWEVVALRLRYSQCLGKMLDGKRILGVNSLQYLRNTDVQWDQINTSNLPIMDIAPNEYERYTVKSGDLLVCEGGEVGRCAIWTSGNDICGFQKALHRLRPFSAKRDLTRFLFYVLQAAARAGAFFDGQESTIPHLTGDKLRSHRFQFPSHDEQTAISAYLDSELTTINQAIKSTLREIELLLELRTCLISGVVTGKQDIRDAASRLPDIAEVDEVFDAREEDLEDVSEEADAEEVEA